jgi:hypothetical protein
MSTDFFINGDTILKSVCTFGGEALTNTWNNSQYSISAGCKLVFKLWVLKRNNLN